MIRHKSKGPKLKENNSEQSNLKFNKEEENYTDLAKLALAADSQKTMTFKTNFLNYLKIFCLSLFCSGKLKEEDKNYLQAENQVHSMIQLQFILNKLMEIENIKEILFTPVQKKMFNLTR